MKHNQSIKFPLLIGFFFSFFFGLIFAMLSFWPLVLVAAIIGGFFLDEMKWGALASALGISLAWFFSFLIAMNNIGLQVEQLAKLFTSAPGVGMILLLLIFLIGAFFGFLGGAIGSGIRLLLFPSTDITSDG